MCEEEVEESFPKQLNSLESLFRYELGFNGEEIISLKSRTTNNLFSVMKSVVFGKVIRGLVVIDRTSSFFLIFHKGFL